MVRIVSLTDLGRRLSAAAPVLALTLGGVAVASAVAADGPDVPDEALTSGASPAYPAAGPAPAPMQLPPVYDTYTTDWARRPVAPTATTPTISALRPVRLDAHGIPAPALAAYHRAADLLAQADPGCGLDWALLGAIGRVESNHARFGGNALDAQGVARPGIVGIALDGTRGTARIRDTDGGTWDRDRAFDRAVGPMQFIPGTWRSVGADGDGDGARDPQDMADAATASGVYLCSGRGDLRRPDDAYAAVLRYNHSDDYVRTVLSIADAYRRGVQVLPVGSLPAARPASGPGSGDAGDSGFAWAGDEPRSTPSSSTSGSTSRPSQQPTHETTTPSPTATRSGSGAPPAPSDAPASPAPVPSVSVPRLPLPSATVSPTTSLVDSLLALPHLPNLAGDPDGLVRVLDPATGKVVCLLDRKVVQCPTAVVG